MIAEKLENSACKTVSDRVNEMVKDKNVKKEMVKLRKSGKTIEEIKKWLNDLALSTLYVPVEQRTACPPLSKSKEIAKCKPYWIIRKEIEEEINTVINSPVETKYCENGTVSSFQGKIIGYNMSYEDILAFKKSTEDILHNYRCEIIMYESCLYNLPYDHRYPNIRSILKEMRKQIRWNRLIKTNIRIHI